MATETKKPQVASPVQYAFPSVEESEVSEGFGQEVKKKGKPEPMFQEIYFPGMIDIVEHNGSAYFLIKEDGKLGILPEKTVNGQRLEPPKLYELPFPVFSFKELETRYELEKSTNEKEINLALFRALVNHHKSISNLPEEFLYELLAAFVLHTYLIEQFTYSPIIYLSGNPGCGKTQTGKGIAYASYHGYVTERVSGPAVIRFAKDYKSTIFFDMYDAWNSLKGNSKDELLGRFEKGKGIPKVLNFAKGNSRGVVNYDPFGATIVASNEPLHETLESRSININMLNSEAFSGRSIQIEDSRELRKGLICFRARYIDKPLRLLSKLVPGRLGDILQPLHSIYQHINEDDSIFINYAKEYSKALSMYSNVTLDWKIVEALLLLENRVSNGILPVETIRTFVNDKMQRNESLTSSRIGLKLKSMGLERVKYSYGLAAILYNREHITSLAKRHGFVLDATPQTPQTPPTPSETPSLVASLQAEPGAPPF